MTILKILKFPNKKLLQASTDIKNINKNIKELIKNMIKTMFFYKGIGIAAPQVGINKNIIIINICEKNQQSLVVINPKIIYKKQTTNKKEGCLSFPNIFIKTNRSKTIKIKFQDINEKFKTIKVNNLLSICIQHEIDHLFGITLYNKMSNFEKKIFTKKNEKYNIYWHK